MIVDRAVDRFGRIDSLINNAGIFISKPFTDYTLKDYQAITAVNLTGFFNMTQGVIRQMLAQGTGGHIVNITTSSSTALRGANPSALVSLTKGGLAAVTAPWPSSTRPRCAVQCGRPRRDTKPRL